MFIRGRFLDGYNCCYLQLFTIKMFIITVQLIMKPILYLSSPIVSVPIPICWCACIFICNMDSMIYFGWREKNNPKKPMILIDIIHWMIQFQLVFQPSLNNLDCFKHISSHWRAFLLKPWMHAQQASSCSNVTLYWFILPSTDYNNPVIHIFALICFCP